VRPGRPAAAVAADLAGDVTAPARFDAPWLASRLRALVGALRARRLCVAYSGGLDSGVLLAALAQLRAGERFVLRAVHVDHRIQPQSAQWARAACARARALRVPCRILELAIERERGESLEAAARDARYRALAAALAPDELLLTAHHQEDQLETVLLALLRGSGVRGLAAMSAVTPWAHTLLLRPLLPVTRAQLEHYAREHALDWSEDPSNADQRFDRNYLRRSVLPLIRQRWPAAAVTVSRSARHLAEARRLLEQLASAALQDARDGAAVRVSVLRRLPLPQRRNAVRQWIAERGLPAPDHRRLLEICGPLLAARGDALPKVSWRGAELRRHADRLFACGATAQREPAAVEQWDWRAHPWLRLSGGGALGLVRDRHGDVHLPALPPLLSVRHRRGGERMQGPQGRVALKDLLQAQGVAPWERAAVPLIVHAGRIIAVADLWLDRSYGCRDARPADRGRFRWRREIGEFDDYD
jgi:tRNA(Ile)-lysidine synthase